MHARRSVAVLGWMLCAAACEKTATPPSSSGPPSATSAASAASAKDLWEGTYTGTWTAGSSVVTYVLTVKKSGSGYRVDVTADGTQTMIRMRGEGRMPPPESGEGAVLYVRFVACEPDDMWKCKGHVVGERLFRIRIVPDARFLAFDKMTAPDEKTAEIPLKMGG